MLKIRLSRVGKKKQPSYRVVVADARAARDGAYVEIVGHYNPRTEPTTFEIDAERVQAWMRKGAQPTLIVEKLLARQGMLPARVWPDAKPKAAKEAKAPAAAAPSAPVAVAEPEAPPAEELEAAEADAAARADLETSPAANSANDAPEPEA